MTLSAAHSDEYESAYDNAIRILSRPGRTIEDALTMVQDKARNCSSEVSKAWSDALVEVFGATVTL